MGKSADRLLEEFRRNKTGRKVSELDKLLRDFGFHQKEGGKHILYFHPEHPDLFITVTRSSGALGPQYVRTAVERIDELLARGWGPN